MFRNLFLALVMMATPPLAQAALAKQHILFVSPHPDDEVLGTGAQIWKAQQRGDDYKVVIVTSGDAYDEALAAWKNSKAAKDLNGDGKIDYLDLGIARHSETLAALKLLGVPEDKVIFLGYPDGGLRKMYGTTPYKSEFTGVNAVPYDFAYRKGAPYTDEAAVEDLTKIIRELNPKTVYSTTLSEEHDDHAMTSEFVSRALKRAGGKRKHLEYLVHWEHHVPAWPGSGATWTQPAGHVAADVSSDLNDLGMSRDLKVKAIKLYATQMAVEADYLLGFAKDSEIFWRARGSVADYLK